MFEALSVYNFGLACARILGALKTSALCNKPPPACPASFQTNSILRRFFLPSTNARRLFCMRKTGYFLLIALALPKNSKILEQNMLEGKSTAQHLSIMNHFFYFFWFYVQGASFYCGKKIDDLRITIFSYVVATDRRPNLFRMLQILPKSYIFFPQCIHS